MPEVASSSPQAVKSVLLVMNVSHTRLVLFGLTTISCGRLTLPGVVYMWKSLALKRT